MKNQTHGTDPAEDMIGTAWFLTGHEEAARALLQHVLADAGRSPYCDLFQTEQVRRLALVKAFDYLFVQGGKALPPAVSQDNPLWLLAPADRAAFALRILFGRSERAAAAFLHLTTPELRNRIESAAATFVEARQTPDRLAVPA